ncbi:MAG: hypothetical protein AVDCRST_MAG51-2853 [uncultured Ramlibacter sp.]|uniref:Uncharacterized protein n=1 Tax=uncultured Ramlibacter sp. TaxID=260755 RepID=A0A6J4Q6S0_9BURK|nr:MAG: hypothetical protein AVDCRST_MAG51-2853 [uncultured Ramlibacter sp.]
MPRILRTTLAAIAFLIGTYPALAADAPRAQPANATVAPVLMHANLVGAPATPGAERLPAQPATLHAGIAGEQPAAAAQEQSERHTTTTAALLAALALMAGIALRRWGADAR